MSKKSVHVIVSKVSLLVSNMNVLVSKASDSITSVPWTQGKLGGAHLLSSSPRTGS